MKFIVSSDTLLKELQVLGGIINTSNTLPILDNFLFDLNANQLILTASDLETSMSSSIAVESEDSGAIALPARLLLDTLKTFPEQPLTFVKTDKHTVEISANNGKYAVAYVEGEDFPKAAQVKDPTTTKIIGDVLATAINATLFASGNDDLRPVMSGVFFQFSTTDLTFVATDAHKLVKYSRKDLAADSNADFIMPKKPLQLLKGILQGVEEDVVIEYNETNAEFSFGNTRLTCRLVDGKYPNYDAVIPKENPNVMQINRSSFLNKAEERLNCEYQGDDLQIGFNSRFIIEMLNNMTCDEIKLSMSLPNRAGIITPLDHTEEGEDITMLVMPVMLNE